MDFTANDNMVVDRNAQQASSLRDALCDLNVCATWFWTTARVIVDEDHRACA